MVVVVVVVVGSGGGGGAEIVEDGSGAGVADMLSAGCRFVCR